MSIDKKYLYEEYITREQSSRDIGKQLGVDHGTILRHLHKYEIPVRCHYEPRTEPINIDKDWLREQYVEEKRSTRDIANEVGCGCYVIQKRLHKWNIPVRSAWDWKAIKINDEWLREQYEVRLRSSYDIAKEVKCSPHGLLSRLKKMGVEINSSIRKPDISGENNPFWKKKHSEITKRKISATHQNLSLNEWRNYVSFEPYCPKFNTELKEEVRNRDERKCQLCGKSEILNGSRLDVHHIDGDKMQGCNGKKWHLISLCKKCHHSKNTLEKEFLIVSNHGGV